MLVFLFVNFNFKILNFIYHFIFISLLHYFIPISRILSFLFCLYLILFNFEFNFLLILGKNPVQESSKTVLYLSI
jgi:hypothetical protein